MRTNSAIFLVGRRLFGEKKNSSSALGNNVLKQVGWRIGSEGFGLLE